MPIKVKTKDWGDKFAHLSEHIGRVSSAVVAHNDALALEAGSHQHAFGRHGWQTGWASQIIRSISGVTPDSKADPYGLNPSMRSWGSVMVSGPNGGYGLGRSGQRVLGGSAQIYTAPLPSHEPPKRGCAAGQFVSPMAQQKALQITKQKLSAKYGKYASGARKKGSRVNGHAVKRLVIVTGGTELLGLGFAFDKTQPPRSEAEARFLIKAFQTGMSIDGVMTGCPWSGQNTAEKTEEALKAIHGVTSSKGLRDIGDKPAMPQMTDLCSLVGVKIEGHTRALSVWDLNSSNQWKLVTIYATDDPRECGEYTLEGTNSRDGKATGQLSGAHNSRARGTYSEGKIILT